MKKTKRILVCPLNWGLGHATRCIPIIKQLIERGYTIIIASDGDAAKLLHKEFPLLQHITLKGYNIRYSNKNSQIFSILIKIPSIIFFSIKEHFTLKKIINKHQIDAVISDNRFGLWNKKIISFYITHQLLIKLPKGLTTIEPLLWRLHRTIIHQYNYCLIPDFADAKLSIAGNLSHKCKLPTNSFFCNPLSRFSFNKQNSPDNVMNILVVLSGVEPQRTMLETLLLNKLKQLPYNSIIVRGKPNDDGIENTPGDNITLVPYALSKELELLIKNADIVICRCGYSSVMDLVRMNKKAILIPTPGQSEQEYLGEYLSEKNYFVVQKQSEIDIENGIKMCKNNKLPTNEHWEIILPAM